MEPQFASLLPEVLLGLSADQFAAIAARALAPRATPVVSTAHLHVPRTTVREQAGILSRMLRAAGRASFGELSADCEDTYEVVARFLAVLDLYRDKLVSFEQEAPLGDLYITWTAPPDGADGSSSPRPGEPAAAGDDAQT